MCVLLGASAGLRIAVGVVERGLTLPEAGPLPGGDERAERILGGSTGAAALERRTAPYCTGSSGEPLEVTPTAPVCGDPVPNGGSGDADADDAPGDGEPLYPCTWGDPVGLGTS